MSIHLTDQEIAEGRRLLKELLPELRKSISLSNPDGALQSQSHMGQSLMGKIREENFDALVIRRSVGGWHADILLADMPVGMPNMMGTPESDPLPDREAALSAGKVMLRQLCRLAMENAVASRDMPDKNTRPFDLHGYIFEIPGEMVEKIGESLAVFGQALFPDVETARSQLRANLLRLMGEDKFDPDIFDELPQEEKMRIGINMATLLLFRDFRYPARPQAEPFRDFLEEKGPSL